MRDIKREARGGEERHLGWVAKENKRNVVADNLENNHGLSVCSIYPYTVLYRITGSSLGLL
jgi:hypothetical protein